MKSSVHYFTMAAVACSATFFAAAFLRANEEEKTMANKQPSADKEQQRPIPLTEEEFKKRLSAEQYHVMREGGTERPFANAYWNNKRAGLYVEAATGEVLFASTDKFDSRTGWPSFTRPIKPGAVVEQKDASHGMVRTEVRAKQSGSHLGHVFDDGPAPTGMRYCINSAALRFIPLEDLEKEGYGEYKRLFSAAVSSGSSPH